MAVYQNRLSIHGITRTFGVCYKTVRRWAGKKVRSLPAFVDTLLPAKNGDVLELDELWSFVGRKACQLSPTTTPPFNGKQRRGNHYLAKIFLKCRSQPWRLYLSAGRAGAPLISPLPDLPPLA